MNWDKREGVEFNSASNDDIISIISSGETEVPVRHIELSSCHLLLIRVVRSFKITRENQK